MFKLKINLDRDHYLTFDSFPTHIVSRFQLPLRQSFTVLSHNLKLLLDMYILLTFHTILRKIMAIARIPSIIFTNFFRYPSHNHYNPGQSFANLFRYSFTFYPINSIFPNFHIMCWPTTASNTYLENNIYPEIGYYRTFT